MKIIFLFIAIVSVLFVQAQDTIIRKNGSQVICSIVSEDSVQVNFISKSNGEHVSSFLSKDVIAEIKHHPQTQKSNRIFWFGFGYGQEFGGAGIQAAAYKDNRLGVFWGVGYNFSNIAYNLGLKLNLRRRNAGIFNPYIEAMYGYNELVSFTSSKKGKTFYGVSMGAGVEWFLNKEKNCAIITGFTIPIREREVEIYAQQNKINIEHPILPLRISVGVMF